MKIHWQPHPDHPYKGQIRLPNNYADLGAGVSVYLIKEDMNGVHVNVRYRDINGVSQPLFQKNMFFSIKAAKRWAEVYIYSAIADKMAEKNRVLSQEHTFNSKIFREFERIDNPFCSK